MFLTNLFDCDSINKMMESASQKIKFHVVNYSFLHIPLLCLSHSLLIFLSVQNIEKSSFPLFSIDISFSINFILSFYVFLIAVFMFVQFYSSLYWQWGSSLNRLNKNFFILNKLKMLSFDSFSISNLNC